MNLNRYSTTYSAVTPRMISGTTNDISIRKFAPLAGRPRQRSRPIAKATPRGTASAIVAKESVNVCRIALRRSGSLKSDWSSPSKPVPTQY
jgi:hypothetical protein